MRVLLVIAIGYLALSWLKAQQAAAVTSAPASALGVQGLPAAVAVPVMGTRFGSQGANPGVISFPGSGASGNHAVVGLDPATATATEPAPVPLVYGNGSGGTVYGGSVAMPYGGQLINEGPRGVVQAPRFATVQQYMAWLDRQMGNPASPAGYASPIGEGTVNYL